MECSEYSDLIVARVAGRIDDADAKALDAHIAGCTQCRAEADASEWMSQSIRRHGERIKSGHLSARLLYEFAESPGIFEDDVAESLRDHLDGCDDCATDFERARDLQRTPLAPEPAARRAKAIQTTRDFVDQLLERVPAPRHAVRYGALAVALIVAAVAIYGVWFSGPPTVARWATSEVINSDTPLQEFPVRLVRRGGSTGPSAEIDFTGLRHLVIAVDLDRIDGAADSYDAVIRDEAGEEIFRDPIAGTYFDDGRFFLSLIAKHFETAEYTLTIDAREADGTTAVVARTVFTVKK